jgi:tetratricopeptide (TPR) repeat protein
MKAFLSHSSEDKEFVRAVAKELGRQFCVFDEQVFATGEEFKSSIERGFDESSVFVLFGSRNAIDSIWVKFETEEAWFRKLRNSLSKSLVYIIDSSVEVEKLPEWLRRTLIRRGNSPKSIARDIRYHLDDLLRERQHPHFIGRTYEIEQLEQVLTPIDGSDPPHAVFVTGLPGIGRRSLTRNVSPSIFNLRKFIEIRVGEGDIINDICISVADHIEPYSTREGFERIVQQIRNLSDEEVLQRILLNLRTMIRNGELPILLDEGGILDIEGYIRDPIHTILRALAPNDEIYLFFVSHRRPQKPYESTIPVVQIGPLRENETKRLLSLLAHQGVLNASVAEVSEIAEYVAGYPPAAYFAIQQAKDYGLDLVIKDKARLVQFRTTVFLKHISGLDLNADEQKLLCLLATYSPLPLPVIADVLSAEAKKLNSTIVHLIDLALIVTTEEGYYRIADPIGDAAVKAYGFPGEEQQRALAQAISEFIEGSEIDSPILELSRVLFRAAKWVKDDTLEKKSFHFANDLIRLTETLYHARDFDRAIEFAYAALEERPHSITAQTYLIRSLIHNEKWQEAQMRINNLRKYGPLKEVYFLKGFLERKRNNIPAAISAYEEAEKLGRKGEALSRELAFCYHLQGNQEKALKYIGEALGRHGDNPYVVDLWALIATSQRDEVAARDALSRLELIMKPLFYYHRLSRVELAFGYLQQAHAAARKAVEAENFPPFEVLAQLAYCEIEIGNLGGAEKLLEKLNNRFSRIHHDIRLGLRCRFEIARGHYGEALSICEQLHDKSTFFYKKIRFDSLAGEIQKSALKDRDRASYEDELHKLGTELEHITQEKFIPTEMDPRLDTIK